MLNVEHHLFSIIDDISDKTSPIGSQARMASSASVEYLQKKEIEDLTIIDVLQIVDGTIQLVNKLEVFKDRVPPFEPPHSR